jgi:O-antigen ligase
VARFAFWAIFVLSLSNLLGLLVTYFGRVNDPTFELAVYPVAFAVCAVLVFAFSKGRHTSAILIAAWAFWLVYALGGLIGEFQLTGTDIRSVLRITVKTWMTIVGLPWLAMRAVSEDKAPRLLRATVLITAIGALVGVFQAILPGFLSELTEAGRATGLWLNANDCGVICVLVLFISLMCPFRVGLLDWLARMLLIAGVAASFSRTAIVVLAVGWIVYGVTAKRFGTLFKSLVAVVVLWAAMLAGLKMIEAISPQQSARINLMLAFLQGNFEESGSSSRTEAWMQSFAVIESNGFVLGLGHGAMTAMVDELNISIAPHNYFLYVWGDAGLIGLLGLLAFQFVLLQQAWKCPRREIRAGLLAVSAILTVTHVFSNSIYGLPFYGAVLACVVVTLNWSRAQNLASNHGIRAAYHRPLRLRGA